MPFSEVRHRVFLCHKVAKLNVIECILFLQIYNFKVIITKVKK